MSCDAAGTVAGIRAVAATVAEHKVELTRLDRDIGDGDHAENLARGFTAVLAKLAAAEPDTPAAVLKLVASTLISTGPPLVARSRGGFPPLGTHTGRIVARLSAFDE